MAVFDVATDTEIDTGKGEGSMKGIPLPIRNPLSIQYVAENNRIYIQGMGSYPDTCDPKYEYTGGIVSIDPRPMLSVLSWMTGMPSRIPTG